MSRVALFLSLYEDVLGANKFLAVRISGELENSLSDPSAPPDTVKENPVIGFDIVESVQLGVRKLAKEVKIQIIVF